MYSNLPKLHVVCRAINQIVKNTCFDRLNVLIKRYLSRLRSHMQTKQDPVDNLNFLMTHYSCVCVCFATKHMLVIEAVRLYTAIRGGWCSSAYIEEKAVYLIIIHDKTVQWVSRKKYCSIIIV